MADAPKPLRLSDLPWFTFLRWIQDEGHPFTGRGLAALARGGTSWLLLWQLGMAVAVGATVAWAIHWAWVPVIERALEQLPLSAGIHGGRLDWPGAEARRLADSPSLAILVDPLGDFRPGEGADIQAELHPDRLRIHGPFGHADLPFSAALEFELGRIEATARWHAWRPFLVGAVAITSGLLLLACWWLLALAYAPPVTLAGWVFRRGLSLAGSWRLACGSLLFGALVALGGLTGYAGGLYRLPGLALSQGMHLVAGAWWLFWGWCHCRRADRAESPEADADRGDRKKGARRRRKSSNPFASGSGEA